LPVAPFTKKMVPIATATSPKAILSFFCHKKRPKEKKLLLS